MRVTTFAADVTPPLGSPLCLGLVPPAVEVTHPLSARGVVIDIPDGPVVLCALDWMAMASTDHERWRSSLAEAAGTTPDRVSIHALHQHDAPGADSDAEELMAANGRPGHGHDTDMVDQARRRVTVAVRAALPHSAPVTHIGCGAADVAQVASNRRVLGTDGKVAHVRYSATTDPAVRAAPEGIIDPAVRAISFFNNDDLVAVLTYYATHPQSYYQQRRVTYDFVGMARQQQQEHHPRALLVHFCGAAGNITAGKYNDGDTANRPVLASRLAVGLSAAVEQSSQTLVKIDDDDIGWQSDTVLLPLAHHLTDLVDHGLASDPKFVDASRLAWARRVHSGFGVPVSCLRIGPARILHLPGELFIEYQLAAQQMRPDLFVAMAAYGDYGPGYIGTRLAYAQGGYETGIASRVSPDAEDILVAAISRLLDTAPQAAPSPSQLTAKAPRGWAPSAAQQSAALPA